jgi:hypothetical protein
MEVAAMVGRHGAASEMGERPERMGMAMPTPGLTPFDQVREASMADEGGWAGAVMETQQVPEEKPATTSVTVTERVEVRVAPRMPVLAAFVALGAAFFAAVCFAVVRIARRD